MIWLVWASLAALVFWLCQLAAEHLPSLPRPRRTPPAPRVPHWARNGHLPPPPSLSSAAAGRHRRKGLR